MNTHFFKSKDVPKNYKKQFKYLCLDRESSSLLIDFKKQLDNDFVICIEKDDKVLGWALINEFDTNLIFQCFVHENFRRQGIGTSLWKETKKQFGNKKVGKFIHDEKSRRFFGKMRTI